MEQWANSVCNNRPISEKRRRRRRRRKRERKHKDSQLRHNQYENKNATRSLQRVVKKIKFCRISQRKLTDQQCWSNGNGLGTKKLEGFHALVHVNYVLIIYEIKISDEGYRLIRTKFKRGALE